MSSTRMPKTVRVRIAVGIGHNGEWIAYGSGHENDDQARGYVTEFVNEDAYASGLAHHWVEADIPLPEPETIEGDVMSEPDAS